MISEAAQIAETIHAVRTDGNSVGVIYLGKPLQMNWEQFSAGPRIRATQMVIGACCADYQVLVVNCIGDWGSRIVNPDKPVGYYWQNIRHVRTALDIYLLTECRPRS